MFEKLKLKKIAKAADRKMIERGFSKLSFHGVERGNEISISEQWVDLNKARLSNHYMERKDLKLEKEWETFNLYLRTYAAFHLNEEADASLAYEPRFANEKGEEIPGMWEFHYPLQVGKHLPLTKETTELFEKLMKKMGFEEELRTLKKLQLPEEKEKLMKTVQQKVEEKIHRLKENLVKQIEDVVEETNVELKKAGLL